MGKNKPAHSQSCATAQQPSIIKMKSMKKYFPLILIIVIAISCQQPNKLTPGEGFIEVDGGKVWYRVTGEGTKTPLLILHGGPGIPSYYLKSLAALGKDRPVIFYDQLGCGRSDRITDTTIMTVQHYSDELGQVIKHFGLKNFYLLGQSWGTMLGTDYYLAHPEGIKALILSSPALSIPRWLADADTLIATLPDTVQQAIRINEKNKTYDAPEYQKAIETYYHKFVLRMDHWPAEMDSCFSQMGQNVYMYMGGPSEFTVVGELKDYDRTKRLHEIKVPTLFICGEFDEARPSTVQYYQSLVPGSKLVVIPGAGHLTTLDKPEESNKAVIDFLNDIENEIYSVIKPK
jgi:proline iminopeptidase